MKSASPKVVLSSNHQYKELSLKKMPACTVQSFPGAARSGADLFKNEYILNETAMNLSESETSGSEKGDYFAAANNNNFSSSSSTTATASATASVATTKREPVDCYSPPIELHCCERMSDSDEATMTQEKPPPLPLPLPQQQRVPNPLWDKLASKKSQEAAANSSYLDICAKYAESGTKRQHRLNSTAEDDADDDEQVKCKLTKFTPPTVLTGEKERAKSNESLGGTSSSSSTGGFDPTRATSTLLGGGATAGLDPIAAMNPMLNYMNPLMPHLGGFPQQQNAAAAAAALLASSGMHLPNPYMPGPLLAATNPMLLMREILLQSSMYTNTLQFAAPNFPFMHPAAAAVGAAAAEAEEQMKASAAALHSMSAQQQPPPNVNLFHAAQMPPSPPQAPPPPNPLTNLLGSPLSNHDDEATKRKRRIATSSSSPSTTTTASGKQPQAKRQKMTQPKKHPQQHCKSFYQLQQEAKGGGESVKPSSKKARSVKSEASGDLNPRFRDIAVKRPPPQPSFHQHLHPVNGGGSDPECDNKCKDRNGDGGGSFPSGGGTGEKGSSSSSSSGGRRSGYKSLTRQRRLVANARERTRVHTIGSAFEELRSQIPSYSCNQKLSKLAILRIACSYIKTLSVLSGRDVDTSFAQGVDQCTKVLQAESRARSRRKSNKAQIEWEMASYERQRTTSASSKERNRHQTTPAGPEPPLEFVRRERIKSSEEIDVESIDSSTNNNNNDICDDT